MDHRPPIPTLAALALALTTAPLAAAADENSAGEEAAAEETAPEQRRQTLGQPNGEFPSYPERVVLYLTNRARSEPTAFSEEGNFEPTPPLRWNLELSRAARWQARHIVEQDCWCEDHSSCCPIERTEDSVACRVTGGTCGVTSAQARVEMWSSAYSGENAANGYTTPARAVDGWIHSSGHWKNINGPGHDLLGVGAHAHGWVQDFGRNGSAPPIIGDGIHFSEAGSTRFGITYHEPGAGGPRSAMLVLDGSCHELSVAYGQPDHGAFEAAPVLEPGCHRYYFHFTDGSGDYHTYPTDGSLGVARGGDGPCPLYQPTRPADTCSPSGQSCSTGDTRRCYTGPYGTEGVGRCQAGSERCVGGDWIGECRYETLPAPEETCGNEIDDDCDGSVDETCRNKQDSGDSDAGPDSGSDIAVTDPPSSGGCSSAGGGAPLAPLSWLGLLVAGVRGRRRPDM